MTDTVLLNGTEGIALFIILKGHLFVLFFKSSMQICSKKEYAAYAMTITVIEVF